jgi:hypothetical protein
MQNPGDRPAGRKRAAGHQDQWLCDGRGGRSGREPRISATNAYGAELRARSIVARLARHPLILALRTAPFLDDRPHPARARGLTGVSSSRLVDQFNDAWYADANPNYSLSHSASRTAVAASASPGSPETASIGPNHSTSLYRPTSWTRSLGLLHSLHGNGVHLARSSACLL